jgi:hypothetical protein
VGESREGEGRAAGPTSDKSLMELLLDWAEATGKEWQLQEVPGRPDEVALVIDPTTANQQLTVHFPQDLASAEDATPSPSGGDNGERVG